MIVKITLLIFIMCWCVIGTYLVMDGGAKTAAEKMSEIHTGIAALVAAFLVMIILVVTGVI